MAIALLGSLPLALSSAWSCIRCTFVNSIDDLTCVMCFQVRSSTRALPYTWQWQPQVSGRAIDEEAAPQLRGERQHAVRPRQA